MFAALRNHERHIHMASCRWANTEPKCTCTCTIINFTLNSWSHSASQQAQAEHFPFPEPIHRLDAPFSGNDFSRRMVGVVKHHTAFGPYTNRQWPGSSRNWGTHCSICEIFHDHFTFIFLVHHTGPSSEHNRN